MPESDGLVFLISKYTKPSVRPGRKRSVVVITWPSLVHIADVNGPLMLQMNLVVVPSSMVIFFKKDSNEMGCLQGVACDFSLMLFAGRIESKPRNDLADM